MIMHAIDLKRVETATGKNLKRICICIKMG